LEKCSISVFQTNYFSDAGCSLERGILFCYFPCKRWAKAETKVSADAEVLEEFNQELDKKDLISPASDQRGLSCI